MTTLVRRLAGGRKGFTQPPFWSLSSSSWDGRLGDKERIGNSFEGYVAGIYKANGVVFACAMARMTVFSEARFAWRDIVDGKPTDLYATDELAVLHRPWENGTTGDLLARMEQDVTLAGNFYATAVGTGKGRHIRRMRPDWVTIILGSPSGDPHALDAKILAYAYSPGGRISSAKPELLTPDEVVHYAPIPDPIAQFRGMSWLTPVLREIESDQAATKHKLNFFRKGATPQLVMKYGAEIGEDDFIKAVELFRESHEGVDNAYKTLHVAGGADAVAVGANLRQLDFKATQGAGETRIAAAAGVGAVMAQLSEGLAGSSLNAGNFSASRRRFADMTLRPNWRNAAGSLERLLELPNAKAELWYDDNIPFLREDALDAVKILKEQMLTIEAAIRAGYKADTARDAVVNNDLRRLDHTGLFSVQLQSPGHEVGAGDKVRSLVIPSQKAELVDLLTKGWTIVPDQELMPA